MTKKVWSFIISEVFFFNAKIYLEWLICGQKSNNFTKHLQLAASESYYISIIIYKSVSVSD